MLYGFVMFKTGKELGWRRTSSIVPVLTIFKASDTKLSRHEIATVVEQGTGSAV